VVGDVEDAARTRGGPDQRHGGRAWKREVDSRDGEGRVKSRSGGASGREEEGWNGGDAGVDEAAVPARDAWYSANAATVS
jgi:hypothetical protein